MPTGYCPPRCRHRCKSSRARTTTTCSPLAHPPAAHLPPTLTNPNPTPNLNPNPKPEQVLMSVGEYGTGEYERLMARLREFQRSEGSKVAVHECSSDEAQAAHHSRFAG